MASTELINILTDAVTARYNEKRYLRGTELGQILGEAYRERGLPTGKGSYKPVVDEAVRLGTIKRAYSSSGTVDILIPDGEEVPAGYRSSISGNAPFVVSQTTAVPTLGLPDGVLSLDYAVYRAFTGREAPRYVDPSVPPYFTILPHATPSTIAVKVISPDDVASSWNTFAKEERIPEDSAREIENMLKQGETSRVWGRIEIREDSDERHWGAKFNRLRLALAVQKVREWAATNGIDLNLYLVADQTKLPGVRRGYENRTKSSSPPGTTRAEMDHVGRLRQHLKEIIDKMSVEQLYQIRVPAEFLKL